MDRQPFFSPLRIATFVVVLSIALTLALIPIEPEQSVPHLGEIANIDIRAPADLQFESDILTQRAQDAAAAVVPTFVTTDGNVGLNQTAALERLLARIDGVRSDPDFSSEERADALAQVPGLSLDPRGQVLTLGFAAAQWALVRAAATALLTGLFESNILDEDVDDLRQALPDRIEITLAPTQEEVLVAIVAPLIAANVVVDAVAMADARDAAIAAVPPVLCTFAAGEIVFSGGAPVGGADLAAHCALPNTIDSDTLSSDELDAIAIAALPLLAPGGGGLPADELMAVLLLAVAVAATVATYLALTHPPAVSSDRRLLLVGALVVIAALAARWYFPAVLPDEQDKSLELILPLAAVAVLAAALLETTLALILAILVAGLAGFAATVHPDFALGEAPVGAQALRPAAVFLFAGIAGVFASSRVERVTQYALVGALVGGVMFLVGLSFWLLDPDRAAAGLGWLAAASALAALFTGVVTIGAFTFLGTAFGITTRLQLLELAQLTQPLLRRLQEEAPGTFHHSLLVATMAERAAGQIDAHPLLVRVGAFYHDIGKLAQPHMYIENQAEGSNLHDDLDPRESARVIQEHVRWGVELARRQRLPERVRDFIPEHHGTRLVTYFYRKAAQIDPAIDAALFTYGGPRPRSRETAIVMLADSCEAVVRSSRNREPEVIDALVDGVVSERLAERQLDDSDLTLRHLRLIGDSFKVTLRGVYHPRIEYPAPTAAERRRYPAAPLPQDLGAAPAPTSDQPVDGGALPELHRPGPHEAEAS